MCCMPSLCGILHSFQVTARVPRWLAGCGTEHLPSPDLAWLDCHACANSKQALGNSMDVGKQARAMFANHRQQMMQLKLLHMLGCLCNLCKRYTPGWGVEATRLRAILVLPSCTRICDWAA